MSKKNNIVAEEQRKKTYITTIYSKGEESSIQC
jgi:hypothetical protein